jgi:exodeoxyribonuclease-5
MKDGSKAVDPDVALLIVDEASMVTAADFKALLQYKHVLYTGDPDQLPPVVENVEEEPDSVSADVLDKPHAKLAVVHRQQAGSSIRVVAEEARQGRYPDYGPSADQRVLHLSEEFGHLGVEQLRAIVDHADVILTQRNSTRITINEYVRRRRGFMKTPVDFVPKAGEILVCSENYQHPVKRFRVANGERMVIQKVLGTVLKRDEADGVLDFAVVGHPEGREQDSAEWTVSSQMLAGDQIRGSVLSTGHVSGPRSGVMRADWGYALTVHKAQGSEWSRVVIVDDMNPDHKIPQNKWHYVAYSRAIDQLIILKVRRDTLLFAPSSAVG